MQQERPGTPAWVWIGLGCLAAVVVGVGALGALSWFGYQKVKQIEAEMRDPEARESAVLGILGAEALPDGYHPLVGFSIPLLLRVAILTDRPPGEDGRTAEGFEERGFIFIDMLQRDSGRDELRDFFEGRTDDPQVLRDHDIRIDADEVLDRGSIETPDATLLWLATRGRVRMSSSSTDGLTTLVLFQCRVADSRGRLGIWFSPDPDPETPGPELDRTGTAADPEAVRAFVEPFSVCPS